MNNHNADVKPFIPKSLRGFSLIELMISLAIGLVILWGVAQVFASNRESYNIQDNMGQLQENGQFALNFIEQQVNQAGFYPTPLSVSGTSATYQTLAFGLIAPVTGLNGTGTANDTITLSYYTATTDCVGTAPPAGVFSAATATQNTPSATIDVALPAGAVAGVPSLIASNTFTLADVGGVSSLLCNGTVLAQGIENMQFSYGVDTSVPPDGFVDTFIPNPTPTEFNNVLVIKVALLVSTVREVRRESDTNIYNLLDVSVGPMNDGMLRRVYSTSIKVRNRCSMMPVTTGSPPCT